MENTFLENKSDAQWENVIDNFGRRDELGETDEVLEAQFCKIFMEYFNLQGEYPTRAVFDEVSNIKFVDYYSRYQLSWSRLCNKYGYSSRNNNKTELKVLRMLSKILDEPFIPQPRWYWLKNKKGNKLRCDAIFKGYNLVVEYDGIQHKEPVPYFGGDAMFNILRENDETKNELILKHGYKLLRINYDEARYNEDYLKRKLLDIGVNIHNC